MLSQQTVIFYLSAKSLLFSMYSRTPNAHKDAHRNYKGNF